MPSCGFFYIRCVVATRTRVVCFPTDFRARGCFCIVMNKVVAECSYRFVRSGKFCITYRAVHHAVVTAVCRARCFYSVFFNCNCVSQSIQNGGFGCATACASVGEHACFRASGSKRCFAVVPVVRVNFANHSFVRKHGIQTVERHAFVVRSDCRCTSHTVRYRAVFVTHHEHYFFHPVVLVHGGFATVNNFAVHCGRVVRIPCHVDFGACLAEHHFQRYALRFAVFGNKRYVFQNVGCADVNGKRGCCFCRACAGIQRYVLQSKRVVLNEQYVCRCCAKGNCAVRNC